MDGAPLAGFDRLYVNLGTSGLFRWAWRIQDLQLDRPRATIEVRRGGKLNWAALIAKLNEDKKPPSDTIARVLIDHIRIDNGDIEYTDANRAGKLFTAVLEPLGIELDGLSTLPEDRGDYLIAAKLPEQGGTLKWKGDVGLTQQTPIDDDTLVELAAARGRAMRDALVQLGLDDGCVGLAAPVTQTARDKLVPSRMNLGVGKKPAAEPAAEAAPAPATEPAPAAVTP
jgi:uncharacterized protein involved in outer membrane biogenesis